MKNYIKINIVLIAITILQFGDVLAQFSGYYDPSNWSLFSVSANSDAGVDASGAPASIIFNGNDSGFGDCCSLYDDLSITIPSAGTVSFDYDHVNPDIDEFYYSVNGTATFITSSGSGTVSVPVNQGDVFGFRIFTDDDCCGRGVATIFNFSAPACLSTSGTDVQTACSSYTWIDGNTYTSSNNSATFTLTNAAGCDSIVTLDLTVIELDLSVTNDDPTLTSEASNVSYQWINCDDSSLIDGETSASFTASENGSYAVIISQDGCADTSECITIESLGLHNISFNNEITVYPNPNSGKLFVKSNTHIDNVMVFDNMGRLVKSIEFGKTEGTIEIPDLAKGSYILKMETQGNLITRNIIKK